MDRSSRQYDPQAAEWSVDASAFDPDQASDSGTAVPPDSPAPPLPPALEVDHGLLLVHPESIGKRVNLRLWFWSFVAYLSAVTAAALIAAAFRGDSLLAYRAWLLACLLFYMSLACTFFPIPTTWVLALAAVPALGLAEPIWARALLIAAVGAAGTMMANLNDYHLWTFVLRHRKVGAIRQTRLYRTAIRWFARAAWLTLVAFTFIPIPVDVVRLLAITFQFPRWRFATACYLGRFVRYAILAWTVAALSRIPGAQWWVVIAIAVLTVAAGLTFGLPQAVRLIRGANVLPPARSENVD